jgi:hypothetical protein
MSAGIGRRPLVVTIVEYVQQNLLTETFQCANVAGQKCIKKEVFGGIIHKWIYQ